MTSQATAQLADSPIKDTLHALGAEVNWVPNIQWSLVNKHIEELDVGCPKIIPTGQRK